MGILPLLESIAHGGLLLSGAKSRVYKTKISDVHFYDIRGGGSLGTVIVLHGISSQASAFSSLIHRLRRSFSRIIAPDAPGHGRSGEPFTPLTPAVLRQCMIEFLDAFTDRPAVLFGGSLGGAVAVGYALVRPERVSGLVLASPGGAAMDEAALSEFMKTFHLKSKAEAVEFVAKINSQTPWYAPLIAPDLIHLFERPSVRHFTGSVSTGDLFQADELSTLKMPIRVVWGREDRLMPAQALEFYRNHLPSHAIFEEPDGFGHCPHLDDPKWLADRVIEMGRRAAGLKA